MRHRRWRHRGRRLQSRLFLWFLLAIVLAILSSTGTWLITHPSPGDAPLAPGRMATRTVVHNCARLWDKPDELTDYLARVHDLVGLEVRVRRDPENLGHMHAMHGGSVTFDGKGHGYIPITRDHELLGALEFDAGPPPPRWWNLFAALGAAILALAVAARAVARRLAWPLEAVAQAAERFGRGELGTRTRLDEGRRAHWVAEEVRDVARAFDTMAERIEGVVRDQRELLGAISHELRSPLGRARVALEIARDRSEESASPSFDEIERQLGEVDAILGDLLAAARAGLSDLRPKPTPLLPWLRARIASEPSPPAIELVADSEQEELQVDLEPALMNRALHNLFANARAHGHPQASPIEVAVAREGARVRIAVRDAGPGFPPDLLSRAFDPFVKADPARTPGARDGSGSGLGLALVRRIVEAHGGGAFARNVVEGERVIGAEVGMDLPLTPR